MIGLDYNQSSIEVREKMSLTTGNICDRLHEIHNKYNVGVVILSTCNRTEFYFSSDNVLSDSQLVEIFLDSANTQISYYIKRDDQLVNYLFELGCGLHSMIIGEDQIITQVSEAVYLSTKEKVGNSAINTLFRHSVTCSKAAKTDVNIQFISPSIVSGAVNVAKKEIGCLTGKKVLVIGNGEMGRLATELFVKEKCETYMTLRSYKHKIAVVLNGCKVVNYKERQELYNSVDVIISATKSPHHTVYYDDIVCLEHKPSYIFDLAVPRDVEPTIKEIENIKCFDVDDIGDGGNFIDKKQIDEIYKIIDNQKVKFSKWLDFYTKMKDEESNDLCSRNRTR